jgi:hypothetical protein
VDELNRAVSQIDSTTQQNSATVEELASTSDNLSNEAKDLANIVGRFKVSGIDISSPAKSGKTSLTSSNRNTGRVAAPSSEDGFEEF